jgi:hypothetical protein
MNFFDPSTASGAIFWGIVAGVFTSGLLSVLGKVMTKIVVPWYQNLVYRGIDLRGKWISQKTYPNGISYHYSMVLDQNAHDLQGSMTISKMNSQPGPPGGHLGDYVQEFVVKGTTWEGFVTINMTSNNRRSLSFATSLLQIQNRGEALVGHMAFRSTLSDQVGSEDIIWTR